MIKNNEDHKVCNVCGAEMNIDEADCRTCHQEERNTGGLSYFILAFGVVSVLLLWGGVSHLTFIGSEDTFAEILIIIYLVATVINYLATKYVFKHSKIKVHKLLSIIGLVISLTPIIITIIMMLIYS